MDMENILTSVIDYDKFLSVSPIMTDLLVWRQVSILSNVFNFELVRILFVVVVGFQRVWKKNLANFAQKNSCKWLGVL